MIFALSFLMGVAAWLALPVGKTSLAEDIFSLWLFSTIFLSLLVILKGLINFVWGLF